MVHVILVHGMNATADSWNTVPSALESVADSVTAVTLPGHDRPLDIWSLLLSGTYTAGFGMEGYVDAVSAALPGAAGRDVSLIGHSMGGAVISHVAAKHPERIASLIYVSAMLPDQGQSATDLIEDSRNDPTFDEKSFLADFWPHRDAIEFFQQPKEPLTSPFSRTAAFEALKRKYIRCTEDDVIPVAVQDRMIKAYDGIGPKIDVRTLKRSHLPQYDDANELAGVLKDLLS